MRTSEKYKLQRLLSGDGELSKPEKEQMLSNLLGEPERTPRTIGYRWRIPVLTGAAGALAASAMLVLYIMMVNDRPAEDDGFTARGGDVARLSYRCVDGEGQSSVCKKGNTLVFKVVSPKAAAYFSAAALSDAGVLVRYFPSKSEESVPISESGVITKGIDIGEAHQPGVYRVFGLFTKDKMASDEMRNAVEHIAEGRPVDLEGVVAFREVSMEVAQ